jgi:hypothetical protein
MVPEEMKEVLWCFFVKQKTLGENCKEANELWRERGMQQ